MARIAINVRDYGCTLFAYWAGDVDWPGAPYRGSTWFHCKEWSGEMVHGVEFHAPAEGDWPGFQFEVITTRDAVQHLIDVHQFVNRSTR